jgi:response regulator of citrate/malate metabolism
MLKDKHLNRYPYQPKSKFMEALNLRNISVHDADEICIIDDSEIPRMLSKKVCERTLPNIPLRIFENVHSALQYLSYAAPRKRVIFLDLYMPELNGWDFIQSYEPEWYETIYLLTTSDLETDKEKAAALPQISGYLMKPLTINMLKKL